MYRKWKEVDLSHVITNLVDKNFTFGNVKNQEKRLPGQFGWHQIRWCYKATACHVAAVRSAKDRKEKKTKRVPGYRGFTNCLFKLWLQRS